MESSAAELAGDLSRSGRGLLLVVTGAGISRASGLPTFRGDEPGAVWNQEDVEVATRSCLLTDPVRQWSWYLRRFDKVLEAPPNAAHRALAALERWQATRTGGFLLITQNIDLLHEGAGSRRLVKVHGTADRLRCSRTGCRYGAPSGSLPLADVDLEPFRREPRRENIPRCPACAALLRAHALFFDEYYDEHEDYGFGQVRRAAGEAGHVLFVGTSFSVGVTELLVRSGLARAIPMACVDPAGPPPVPGIRHLRAPAEELLPAVCQRLGAG